MKPPREKKSQGGGASTSSFKQTSIGAFFAQPTRPTPPLSGSKRVLEDSGNKSQPEAKQACKGAEAVEKKIDSRVSNCDDGSQPHSDVSAARVVAKSTKSDKTNTGASKAKRRTGKEGFKCAVKSDCPEQMNMPGSAPVRTTEECLPEECAGTTSGTQALAVGALPSGQRRQPTPSRVENECLTLGSYNTVRKALVNKQPAILKYRNRVEGLRGCGMRYGALSHVVSLL
jgi:hypothetical protein